MKHDILCLACATENKKMPDEPGFHSKFVAGRAKKEMTCDGPCGEEIQQGTVCEAFSLWMDGEAFPDWECDFLDLQIQ